MTSLYSCVCVLGGGRGGEKVERVQTFGGLLRGSVPLLSEHTNRICVVGIFLFVCVCMCGWLCVTL